MIKNKSQLATTETRKQALEILEAGIKNVLPDKIVKDFINFDSKTKTLKIQEEEFIIKDRIFVIGAGKATGKMAESLEQVLGKNNITAGIINCPDTDYKLEKIIVNKASHPIPDQSGYDGMKKMLALKNEHKINPNDLIICLISGGTSAMMPAPIKGITLEDEQNLNKVLISSGADIKEINTVRKKISQVKGGKLGLFFSPIPVITLILSDVIGDDLETIASGPTVPDTSTDKQAYSILEKYKLLNQIPPSIVTLFEKNITLEELEPEKLENCHNFLIGNSKIALSSMQAKAKELELEPILLTAQMQGNPEEAANLYASEIKKGKFKDYNCLILGGETTPKLPADHGKGGRNQHYVLATLQAFIDQEYEGNFTIASCSTDGYDFMKEVAGAIADQETTKKAEDQKLDIKAYLKKFDSNSFFTKIGNSLIETGRTGTNVGDIVVYILK
ncbi:MAG: DUF4147 domain-containing protein [Patescibacteria group bacterium]